MKKTFLIIVSILVLATLFFMFSKQPVALSGNSSAARLANKPFQVVQTKRHLIDPSRKTDANGDYEGSPVREFDLFTWRPKQRPESPQPLLIYSHGFMSHGKGGSYIAEYLAAQGYTVAAATYPLSNYSAPGGPKAEDVVNQPADVSFIIDTLLAENADPSSKHSQYIDPNRVAAAGLSLGGMTTKLAAYHPRYADQRIKAAVSIAGPSFMLAKHFFDGRNIPFMMIATPQDAIVPFDLNAVDIRERIDGAILLTMNGASHAGYSSTAKWLRWFNNPDSLGCRAIKGRVDTSADNQWYEQIGSIEEGVIRRENKGLCEMDPLPTTINPLHQHRLTTLAVSSFLECQFSSKQSSKTRACEFLLSKLAEENSEISILR